MNFDFIPVDSADGSKRFEYRFALQNEKRQLIDPNRPSTYGPTQTFAEMRDELAYRMKIDPYCTESYFIYDQSFDGSVYLLRGECNDSPR